MSRILGGRQISTYTELIISLKPGLPYTSHVMINVRVLKLFLSTAILAGLGVLGNYLAQPIAYGVAFIFGSIFSIIAIGLLGPVRGVFVAFVASSYTFFLWNHPYAVMIFTTEALWISVALYRKKHNIVIIDACFWLTIGAGLVVIFYGGVMGMNAQSVLMICLKQSINGVFNALIASIILYHTPIARLLTKEIPRNTYKNLILNVICAFLVLPTLSLLLYQNYQENRRISEDVANRVLIETGEIEKELADWLLTYVNATSVLAELG
ncbi:MAG: hypothetical protein KUG73_13250, partial [Pseudomonadales bacterium]|nr:hypothetical protein [Pseudomonadales bacterium]